MFFPIDLHMHSKFSDDGEFTPEDLVRQCKAAGITMMAISDHNCARANAIAAPAAERAGIVYIPAIEIDCTFEGVDLHVLGYGIDYLSRDFEEIEDHIMTQEKTASKLRLKGTRRLGFEVSEEELVRIAGDGVWTGELFAEVLLAKEEYLGHELLKPYRPGGARSDNPYVNFYWDFYSQGKPCYVEMNFPTLEDTIEVIHRNGGKAVLAHPGNNLKNRFPLFDAMIPLGLDGVEAFSTYHSSEDSHYFFQKAMDQSLIITCGSDYHGKIKPSISLGASGCTLSVEELCGMKNGPSAFC